MGCEVFVWKGLTGNLLQTACCHTGVGVFCHALQTSHDVLPLLVHTLLSQVALRSQSSTVGKSIDIAKP